MRSIFTFLILHHIISTFSIGQSCVYQELQGQLIIDAEDLELSDDWEIDSSETGYSGDGYITWTGSDNFNKTGEGLIVTSIVIKTVGTYTFQFRSKVGQGNSFTDFNDTWVKFPDASNFYAEDGTSIVYPHGSGQSPNPEGAGENGWFKVYLTGTTNWTWSTNTFDNDPHAIKVQFDEPGSYTMQLSARSSHHLIDRIILSQSQPAPTSLSTPTSTCIAVGLEDPIQWTELEIYPNPVSNSLFISDSEAITTSLYSTSGSIIYHSNEAKSLEIDVSDYSPGIYMIKVDKKAFTTRRLIVIY